MVSNRLANPRARHRRPDCRIATILKMDLLVGVLQTANPSDGFPTCVFAANYNECILAEIRILSVFLGRGSCMSETHKSLQERELACKTIGWFKATPGQIVDEVHFLLNPKSSANTFCRSIDKLIDRAPIKDDVVAKKPVKQKFNDGKPLHDGRKPRSRARTPAEPVHCS